MINQNNMKQSSQGGEVCIAGDDVWTDYNDGAQQVGVVDEYSEVPTSDVGSDDDNDSSVDDEANTATVAEMEIFWEKSQANKDLLKKILYKADDDDTKPNWGELI